MPSHEAPQPWPDAANETESPHAEKTPVMLTPGVQPAANTPLPIGGIASAISTPLGFGSKPRPRPPQRPIPAHAGRRDSELELVEAEEIPASSSDAPPLDVLLNESQPGKPQRERRAADEFLVNLSPGADWISGAPTIDVSSLSSPPAPADVITEDELGIPGAAPGMTVPLFDLSAVLPKAEAPHESAPNTPRLVKREDPTAAPPITERSTRSRKFVVAPHEPAPRAKPRRTGAAVWFALAAAAAGVAAVIALRGQALVPSGGKRAEAVPTPPATLVQANIPAPLEDTSASAAPAASAVPAASVVPESNVRGLAAPVAPNRSPKPNAASAVNEGSSPAAAGLDVKVAEAHAVPPPADPGAEFDPAAARNALLAATSQASSCRKDGDPSGTASLTITFAPSGRVTSATVQGPPFAGTATGGCIASAMRHASVPPFSGDYVTVSKTIVIQ